MQSITNKHADYTAIGKPVINTQPNKEYRDLVDNNFMGINCEPGNIEDVRLAILKLYHNRQLILKMGENSRSIAEKYFDRSVTYKEIIEKILKS